MLESKAFRGKIKAAEADFSGGVSAAEPSEEALNSLSKLKYQQQSVPVVSATRDGKSI